MYNINYLASPAPEVMKKLNAGLSEHAMQVLGVASLESFGFTANNDVGEIIGGCTGYLMFGSLGVKMLWIKEEFRNKGLGKSLMLTAEKFAHEKGCRYLTVETFNWQAKNFYEKLGFDLTHSYDGYDFDSTFYFFRKKIS